MGLVELRSGRRQGRVSRGGYNQSLAAALLHVIKKRSLLEPRRPVL